MQISPSGEQQTRRGTDDSWFNGVPPLAQACADGDTLHGAGRAWDLIETDGHCRGHLCLHDAVNDVLISGDQVLPAISPNVSVISNRPEGNPLRISGLAGAARALFEKTLVLPSHGKPLPGPASSHRRRALASSATAGSRCAHRREPRTAYELLPVMFGRTLRGFHRFRHGRNARAPALPLARPGNGARFV
jgi:glyoxylase-like metal-dependent hydrolase (beta-lactamase superfamily II)